MASNIKLKNNINSEFTVTHEDNQGAISVSSTDLAKVVSVDTIADLRATTKAQPTVWVSGYYEKGDGAFGSNIFEWDATSTEDDNGGTIIKLDSVATGRYKLRYSGSVNVKWFGVTGDGVTDDYTNFQAALDASASIGDTLFIPIGTYILGNRLTQTSKSINIQGENLESTILKFTNTAAGGLFFTLDPQTAGVEPDTVDMRDFTIETAVNIATEAVRLEYTAWQGTAAKTTHIDNIRIKRDDATGAGSFLSGIKLKNVFNGEINRVFILGDDARVATFGINVEDSVGIRFTQIDINRVKIALYLEGIVHQFEGLIFNQAFFYDVNTGIYANNGIHFFFTDSHVNINSSVADYCVRLVDTNQSTLTNNLLYCGGDTTAQLAVIVESSNTVNIFGNKCIDVTSGSGSMAVGAKLSVLSIDNHINGNYFSGTTGIQIDAGSNRNTVVGNRNAGVLSDNGTGNLVASNTQNGVAATGTFKADSGINFQNGDFSVGSISTDGNWGAFIKGRVGTQADIALCTGAGSVVVKIDSSGNFIATLPTSSAGLPSGALWNNLGVVNIV